MDREPLDVVVVGAVGVDTNVYLYGEDVDWSVEGNFTENLDCVGQAGGYASRGYAALGRRTGFVGYVGDDACGSMVRTAFARDGIESLLFVDPRGTNRSVNIMFRDGRRRSFYDAKSAMELHPDPVACRRLLAGCRLVHMNIQNWCRELLPLARELGATVASDLQDVVRADDPYRWDFVAGSDILFFSTTNFPDPVPLIRRYLEVSARLRLVVVGMGARGCALATREGVRLFPPVPLDRPVVDTNGAGDSLAVGFLTAHVLDGLPPEEAVRCGQIAARHACTLRGTSDGLITAARLEERRRAVGG